MSGLVCICVCKCVCIHEICACAWVQLGKMCAKLFFDAIHNKKSVFLRLVMVHIIIAPFCLCYCYILWICKPYLPVCCISQRSTFSNLDILKKADLPSVHWLNFVASTNYEKKFLKNDMHWLNRASSLLKLAF